MTRPDPETQLRELMRSRVATLTPPISVYDAVRARHQRSRRRVMLASALTVAAVLVGVPLGLGLRHGGSPGPAAAVRPAPEIRGSLAGDAALLAEARQWVQEKTFTGPDRLDSRTVRVRYAEQRDGYLVVLVVGRRVADGGIAHAFLGRRAGQRGFAEVDSSFGGSARPDFDERMGQAYLDPLHVLIRVNIGDRSFGIAIFPPGNGVTIGRQTTLGADCRVDVSGVEPVPLVDGAAFFQIAQDSKPYITVADAAGAVFLRRVLRPNQSSLSTADYERLQARIRTTIRGGIDDVSLGLAASGLLSTVDGGADTPERYFGVWAAQQPGSPGYSYLVGAQFASGAMVLTGSYETHHGAAGSGGAGWATGCVPAGRQDDVILSARLTGLPGKPLIAVGPAATRQLVAVFAGGAEVSVPLTAGGGFLQRAGTVVNVRAYDADGRLLAEGAPGQGLVAVAVGPR